MMTTYIVKSLKIISCSKKEIQLRDLQFVHFCLRISAPLDCRENLFISAFEHVFMYGLLFNFFCWKIFIATSQSLFKTIYLQYYISIERWCATGVG